MIAEALDRLANMAVAGRALTEFHPSAEPKHVYLLNHGGSVTRHEAATPPRADVMFSLPDFCRRVALLGSPSTSVFCGRGQATAVLDDDGDRRDRLSIAWKYSQPMRTLMNAETTRHPLGQRAFVELLRISMAGTVDPAVVEVFRQIKSSTRKSCDAGVRTGRESIDAAAMAEVMSAGKELPDEIDVRINVYLELSGEDWERHIRCAIVVDLFAEGGPTFTLIPLAGQVQRAEQDTDDAIRDRITADTKLDRVVCGTPG